MHQALHVLIVDSDRRAALAAHYGSRWLVPVVSCHERLRAEPLIARWTAEQGVTTDVMGQWLGRISANPLSLDWLVVARAAGASPPAPDGQQWTPLDTLDPDRALLDYQGWALARALRPGELPAVPGPFGTLTWLDDVLAWIVDVTHDGPLVGVTPFRLTPHEVVLRVDSTRSRAYFKGLTAKRAAEPRVTRALFELEPDGFATTIALETRADASIWWLAAECPGRPLGEPPVGRHAAAAARALARVQQRALAQPSSLRALPVLDVEASLVWCLEQQDDARCRGALARAGEIVAAAKIPHTWAPLDLDPTNILVDDGSGPAEPRRLQVRFIDLDDSYLGAAPLAMAVFARRCRDRSLYAWYDGAWTRPLGIDWASFESVAVAAEAWLGRARLQAKIGCGELQGETDLAEAALTLQLRHQRRMALPIVTGRSRGLTALGRRTQG